MVDPAVIDSVKNYLRGLARKGLAARFGVVYGSQTAGSTHQWSDIDVVVVSPMFDGVNYESVFQLWRVAARTDNRIEPIACGEQEWEKGSERPIVEIARRDGVIVYPDGEDVRQAG